jgi:RNA polymerase sigma-70 factor (ECF subfamily)
MNWSQTVQVLSPRISATETADSRLEFESAVMPCYAGLVRRLTLILGDPDDARDAAQEAYLRAFRAWPKFDGVDVRAWLYTIGIRLAFNDLRSRRRWLRAVARVQPKAWPDPFDPDLAAALASLDPRTRSALLLTLVDGYTQGEAAGILGVPVGTVSSWIARGRRRLRESLEI